jgi:hypothetical protein
MVLQHGQPAYVEGRRAGITAQFDDTLDQTTLFELSLVEVGAPRRRLHQH